MAQNKVHNIHEKNNQIVVTNLAEVPVANEDDVMRCVCRSNVAVSVAAKVGRLQKYNHKNIFPKVGGKTTTS